MIRQFDVFRNPLRTGREQRPFVIAVQHHFFDDLPTRVVVPLFVGAALQALPRLNPVLHVLGQDLRLSPTELFSLSSRHLRKAVANLEADRGRIVTRARSGVHGDLSAAMGERVCRTGAADLPLVAAHRIARDPRSAAILPKLD